MTIKIIQKCASLSYTLHTKSFKIDTSFLSPTNSKIPSNIQSQLRFTQAIMYPRLEKGSTAPEE